MNTVSSPQSPERDHRSTEKDWRDADYINAARAIASAHGQDPDEEAPRSEMCNDDNSTVPWFMVFMEDAEAALDAVAPPAHQENSPRSAPESAPAQRASHNSGERLPSSDAADAGADTEPAPQVMEALDWLINCIECEVNVPGTTTVFQLRLAKAKEALALTPVVAREPVGWREALALILEIAKHIDPKLPLDDGRRGMEWWNGLSDDDRKQWSVNSGSTGRAADAWEAYKRQKAES